MFEELLNGLKSKATEIENKIDAIFSAAEVAGRGLSDEEDGKVKTLESELEANGKEQEKVEGQIEAKRRNDAKIANRPAPTTNPRKTQPNAVVTVKGEGFESDPRGGFKNERDFMQVVMQDGISGGRNRDPRLSRLLAAVGSDEHQTNNDPYGGFLIPEQFSPDLLKIMPEGDPVSGRTTMVPMAATSVKIPYRVDKNHSTSVSGGLTVARRAETVAATASRMQLGQVKLESNSLFGLAYASDELLADSPMSFAAILAAGFSDEFNSTILNERLNGTGVGQYLGIYNSPAKVEISIEGGQSNYTIVYANILKMRARCYGYGKAIWMANHNCIPQLAQLNDAYNGVYWNSAEVDKPDMLLGRPIVYTEYVPALGTPGDITLVNWSEYLEGVYQPLQRSESIHVRFAEHERAFKFWIRNAGTPWWETAMTPKNGDTLSPFITLAERNP